MYKKWDKVTVTIIGINVSVMKGRIIDTTSDPDEFVVSLAQEHRGNLVSEAGVKGPYLTKIIVRKSDLTLDN